MDERGVGGSCCRNKHGIGARSDGGTARVRSGLHIRDAKTLERSRLYGDRLGFRVFSMRFVPVEMLIMLFLSSGSSVPKVVT